MHNLPANPMQPYIDYLHEHIGITKEDQLTLWCHADGDWQEFTAFIGHWPCRIQYCSSDFGNLVSLLRRHVSETSEPAFDPIALGA